MTIATLATAIALLGATPALAQVPASMQGSWDRTLAECAGDPTMARLTIRPDRLSFAWGYAEIEDTERRGDVLFLRGAVHQEGMEDTEAIQGHFRLDHRGDPARLRLTRKDIEVVDLVRCPDQQNAALDSGTREGVPLPVGDGLCDTLAACAAGDTAATAAGRSAYTTLDYARCDVLEVFEEGSGSRLRCPGWNGTPLFVSEGDLRFDVDVGREDDDFIAISPFNSLGETVEWRVSPGGALRAVILRYRYDSGTGTPSDLAVISAPSDARGSCYLGFVPPDAAPSQNQAARVLADRSDSLPCIDAR